MSIKRKNTIKKYTFITLMLAYPTVLFLIFYVGVNFNSFVLAFQKININGEMSFNGFNNFKDFFSLVFTEDSYVGMAIMRSVSMFFINLVICMPLYIAFSYYVHKKYLWGNNFRLIIMIPAVVSTFIMSLLFKKFVDLALPDIMLSFGFKDFPKLLSNPQYTFGTTLFYMIWVSFSTSLIVYTNAMNSIEPGIMESAAIEGANMFQEIWYIVLPLIYPTISTFLITGVAGIFIQQGPLMAFWMYSAPPETYNFSYYMLVEVMANPSTSNLKMPILAAMGIVITLISAPFTYLVKYLLDTKNPMEN